MDCKSAPEPQDDPAIDPAIDPAVDAVRIRALTRAAAEHLTSLDRIIRSLESFLSDHPQAAPATFAGARPHPGYRGLGRLTEREKEVLGLLVQGLSNRRIARTLHISEPTVKNHLHAVFLKLEVTDRTQAVAKVLGAGPRLPLPHPTQAVPPQPLTPQTAPPQTAPSQASV